MAEVVTAAVVAAVVVVAVAETVELIHWRPAALDAAVDVDGAHEDAHKFVGA